MDMPIEERLTTLERNFSSFQRATTGRIDEISHYTTMLIGVVQSQNKDIKAILTRLDEHSGILEQHTARFEVLESKVDTIESKVNIIAGRVDAIESKVNIMAVRVDAIESKIDLILARLPEKS